MQRWLARARRATCPDLHGCCRSGQPRVGLRGLVSSRCCDGRFRGCGGRHGLGYFRQYGGTQLNNIDGLRCFRVQCRGRLGGHGGERRGDVEGGIFIVLGGSHRCRRSHDDRCSYDGFDYRGDHGRCNRYRGFGNYWSSLRNRWCCLCYHFWNHHGCNCNSHRSRSRDGRRGRPCCRCRVATAFTGLLGLIRGPGAVFLFLTAADFRFRQHGEGTRLADIRHVRAELAATSSSSRGGCANFGRCVAWGVIRTVATTTATTATTTTTATAITTVLPGTFRCAGIQLVIGFFLRAGFTVGSWG